MIKANLASVMKILPELDVGTVAVGSVTQFKGGGTSKGNLSHRPKKDCTSYHMSSNIINFTSKFHIIAFYCSNILHDTFSKIRRWISNTY
jgi:hypothetical protein